VLLALPVLIMLDSRPARFLKPSRSHARNEINALELKTYANKLAPTKPEFGIRKISIQSLPRMQVTCVIVKSYV